MLLISFTYQVCPDICGSSILYSISFCTILNYFSQFAQTEVWYKSNFMVLLGNIIHHQKGQRSFIYLLIYWLFIYLFDWFSWIYTRGKKQQGCEALVMVPSLKVSMKQKCLFDVFVDKGLKIRFLSSKLNTA